jgi:cell shape-determining protein MreC
MDWMMSPEELFKIEQQRIHKDLAHALFESEKLREEEQRNWEEEQKRWEEEQRRCEDLERENARLRQLLGELDSNRDS